MLKRTEKRESLETVERERERERERETFSTQPRNILQKGYMQRIQNIAVPMRKIDE